jgi:hypothetical protein
MTALQYLCLCLFLLVYCPPGSSGISKLTLNAASSVVITDILVSKMAYNWRAIQEVNWGVKALGRSEGFDPRDMFPWSDCKGLA